MINSFKTAVSEIWQDKRTLWSRLWLPFLLFSGLLFILSLSLNDFGDGSANFGEEDGEGSVSPNSTVGIVANGNGDSLIAQLKIIEGVDYQMIDKMDTVQTMMDNGDLDLAIVIDEYFDDAIKTGNSGEIILFHDGYDEALKQGINNNILWYERIILNNRLAASGFDASFTDPVNVSEIDASNFTGTSNNDSSTSSDSEDNPTVFNEIGGAFILLILYFAFLGGIYPALSLFTTEVVSQIKTDKPQTVLLGRILAVAAFGILHSLLLFGVMLLLFKPYGNSGNIYSNMIKVALRADLMPLILLSLIPLTAVFSTFLTWAVTKRGTFKEGQNRLQPLKISVGLFLLIGLTAGFGTSFLAYLVPVVNVGTLSRALIQDNLNWLNIVITYAASFGIAYVCFQQALKEFEKRIQQPIVVDEPVDNEEIIINNLDTNEASKNDTEI